MKSYKYRNISYKCLESKKFPDVIVFTVFKEGIFVKVRIKLQNADNYSMF